MAFGLGSEETQGIPTTTRINMMVTMGISIIGFSFFLYAQPFYLWS